MGFPRGLTRNLFRKRSIARRREELGLEAGMRKVWMLVVGVHLHDFYIVRLFTRGRERTLVVLLQPQAWDIVDGDTVPGHLDTVVEQ